MPDGFVDPYIDQSTGVLRNLVGASTYDELENAEGELASSRTAQFLEALPCDVEGTLSNLCDIHRWLFQDIYDWAGEIRKVEIRKAGTSSQFFLPSADIQRGIAWAHEELENAREHPPRARATVLARLRVPGLTLAADCQRRVPAAWHRCCAGTCRVSAAWYNRGVEGVADG